MAEQIWNNLAPSTLSANITSTSATSCTVTSATPYPTTGNFRIMIDNEIMEVTAVSGTTFTIARGTENTTAATHTSGTNVNIMVTQAALLGLRSDVNQMGTYANLPASGMQAGDRYRCTDGPYEFIYNGSVWVPFIGGVLQVTPPATYSWTNYGGSPSSTSTTNGTFTQTFKQTSGQYDHIIQYTTLPTPPYKMRMGFRYFTDLGSGTLDFAGMVLLATGAGFWYFGTEAATGGYVPSGVGVVYWPNPTSSSPTNSVEQASMMWPAFQEKWVIIQDDNTNWNFYISLDGTFTNSILIYSMTRNTTITANAIGFTMSMQSTTTVTKMMQVFDFSSI